jgi:hypothetical protein
MVLQLYFLSLTPFNSRQNSFEDKNKDIIEMETEDAYGMVLKAVLKWVEGNMDPKTSRVFFVTMSPTHTR